jgi:Co/Zn/Cd efflux system component
MVVLGHTFGFHRAEVIAALVSVLTIWILTGFLVHEAIQRLRTPQVINAKLVKFGDKIKREKLCHLRHCFTN